MDGRSWELPGRAGPGSGGCWGRDDGGDRASGPQGRRGWGVEEARAPWGQADSTPLRRVGGSEAAGREERVDAGGLNRRRPALSGAAWFPRFGARKNVPSHGAALGGAEVPSPPARSPPQSPGRDPGRGALAGAGRLREPGRLRDRARPPDLEKPSPPGAEEKVTGWPSCRGAPTGGQGSTRFLRPGRRSRTGGPGRTRATGSELRAVLARGCVSRAPRLAGYPRCVRGPGLRLGDIGRLAVTEALGWPFPAL